MVDDLAQVAFRQVIFGRVILRRVIFQPLCLNAAFILRLR